MTHQLNNVKVSRDDKTWEVKVEAEVPAETLARYREEALKEMQREAKLDGFRPGKAPIERIIAVYGEPAILRQAAERAIKQELPELLAEQKMLIVESPRVETATPESGKPLTFTARAALAPEITVPDYKKAAAKINAKKEAATVSDKEHEEAMAHLKREKLRIEKVEAGAEPQQAAEEVKALAEADLPALDEAFVQSLGYESVEKFSHAVRENIKTEKELQAREKRRAELLDELVKDSTIRYPAMLYEYELDEMEARMQDDLARLGMQFDAYLSQIKKTREDLRREWHEAADKRARVRLILAEIARKENIEPATEAFEHEVAHAKEHYPQADEAALRAHIAHAMRNEAVLEMLEQCK